MLKRIFDILFSLLLCVLLAIPIAICIVVSSIDTKQFGLFTQIRVGQFGNPFRLYKIRTMKGTYSSSVSTSSMQITTIGAFFRKYKIDELPQLFNVLIGNMSFVGPRPDVERYYVHLTDEEKFFLTVKPGITGLAQLKYRNEQQILESQSNPEQYYENVIWKDKVALNNEYARNYRFSNDIRILVQTIKAVVN